MNFYDREDVKEIESRYATARLDHVAWEKAQHAAISAEARVREGQILTARLRDFQALGFKPDGTPFNVDLRGE